MFQLKFRSGFGRGGVQREARASPALPHVSHGSLGKHLTAPDVPRRYWYAFKSSSSRRRANFTDSAMGITYIFNAAQLVAVTPVPVGLLYHLISLSFNVVLAIVTVTRVVV